MSLVRSVHSHSACLAQASDLFWVLPYPGLSCPLQDNPFGEGGMCHEVIPPEGSD